MTSPWLSCDLAVTELRPRRELWPLLAVIIGPRSHDHRGHRELTVSSWWPFIFSWDTMWCDQASIRQQNDYITKDEWFDTHMLRISHSKFHANIALKFFARVVDLVWLTCFLWRTLAKWGWNTLRRSVSTPPCSTGGHSQSEIDTRGKL